MVVAMSSSEPTRKSHSAPRLSTFSSLDAIHGGLLKLDVVEGTDDEVPYFRVWSLPCWDLAETSKRDDGIDLLKDNQALRRLLGSLEKAKMDLSSLTQTNIREAGKIEGTCEGRLSSEFRYVFYLIASEIKEVTQHFNEHMVVRSNGAHKQVLVDEMMTSYQD
ncbi:hypothetical protein Syun_027293 [Stephania yunnanensis]|uniref:Uncharacterized protein n=1 Tax=Stephania yunnanensis TaxID=152371 RepID=A0AAP0HPU6_9MAGN